MADTKPEHLLNTQEAAQYLGITPKGMHYLVGKKHLTPFRIPGSRRSYFDKAELDRYRGRRRVLDPLDLGAAGLSAPTAPAAIRERALAASAGVMAAAEQTQRAIIEAFRTSVPALAQIGAAAVASAYVSGEAGQGAPKARAS